MAHVYFGVLPYFCEKSKYVLSQSELDFDSLKILRSLDPDWEVTSEILSKLRTR